MLPGRVIPFDDPNDPHSQVTGRPQRVVQIGRDPELLRLRARIIGSAGYAVHSMAPDEATAELRTARAAQIWVFCHTLEFYELALLAVGAHGQRVVGELLDDLERLAALGALVLVRRHVHAPAWHSDTSSANSAPSSPGLSTPAS